MTEAQRKARAKKAAAASVKARRQRAKDIRTFTHPRTLDSHAIRALTHAIGQSCVGVLSKGNTVIGTGTLIDIDGRTAILTARHVIEGSDVNALLFFLPKEGAEIGDSFEDIKRRIKPQHLVAPVRLEFDEVYAEAGIDLALLIPRPHPRLEGWPRPRKLHRGPISSATPLLLMGYPHARAIPISGNAGMASPNLEYPRLLPPIDHQHFDPRNHILVDYPSADDFKPNGYSGGAVWRNPRHPPPALWSANPEIAAVVIEYIPTRKALICVRSAAIRRFIKRGQRKERTRVGKRTIK